MNTDLDMNQNFIINQQKNAYDCLVAGTSEKNNKFNFICDKNHHMFFLNRKTLSKIGINASTHVPHESLTLTYALIKKDYNLVRRLTLTKGVSPYYQTFTRQNSINDEFLGVYNFIILNEITWETNFVITILHY